MLIAADGASPLLDGGGSGGGSLLFFGGAVDDGVGQSVELRQLVFGERGSDGQIIADELSLRQLAQHLAHELSAVGGPGAVLDERDLPILEIVAHDIVQQVLHGHEHAHVVRGGGKDQIAETERLGYDKAGRGDGGVVQADLHAALAELGRQDVGDVLRVPVDGGVRDHDALFLRRVAGPLLILFDIGSEVLAPDETVQGADILDWKRGRLFQDILDLGTVFADDIGVIAAGFAEPVVHEVDFIGEDPAVEGAEGAEGVGGEEDAVGGVEGHHDLRPVDHRREDEVERVTAGAELVPFADGLNPGTEVDAAEELGDQLLDLIVADDLCLGVAGDKEFKRCRMVGFHVAYDKIVKLSAVETVGDIVKKGLIYGFVYRVEKNGLFVKQQIGVVGHPVGNSVYSFKTDKTSVICADPDQVVKDFSGAMHDSHVISA